jgi:hypothetical protein
MREASPDHEDRVEDFYSRHGGPATQTSKEAESTPGIQGWSEVYAADGYTLRCDWSIQGSYEEMKYSEVAPSPDRRR